MTKTKTFNKILSVLLLILLVATLFVAFSQTGFANADTTSLGTLNYEGSKNHCKYDIVISAGEINGTLVTDSSRFRIYLQGVSCKCNIFTSFNYDITCILFKDGNEQETYHTTFTIANDDNFTQDVRTLFTGHYGNGYYTLTIVGKIYSNVNVNINKSLNFTIQD